MNQLWINYETICVCLPVWVLPSGLDRWRASKSTIVSRCGRSRTIASIPASNLASACSSYDKQLTQPHTYTLAVWVCSCSLVTNLIARSEC